MSNIVSIRTLAEPPEAFQEDWLRLSALISEAQDLGDPAWRPMLSYVARLHEKSIHHTGGVLPYPWEEIGPGYIGGRAFGHWDIIHQILDTLDSEPCHARRQLMNYFHNQDESGYMPGTIYFSDNPNPEMVNRYPCYSNKSGHPPVWPFAVDGYFSLVGDEEILASCIKIAERQIDWFERNRKAADGGFFYLDVLENRWESGVDEGIRFIARPTTPMACVDATSHVYLLCNSVNRWRHRLAIRDAAMERRATEIRSLITSLFCEESGFFFDAWSLRKGSERPFAFEGMWPLVVGAALPEQAERVIRENLCNRDRFFTPHPISTVSVSDVSRFALRCWRGPAWNSMTYWAARGCARYGYFSDAAALLEAALECSSEVFSETGAIWEFYHPYKESPLDLERKPQTGFNTPCRDYLGHNPLLAMARMWERCGGVPSTAETATV
jgi:putative isomerase